ncbi:MAG: hypothetical protein MHPSP_001621 [Paramarteilia canceri]
MKSRAQYNALERKNDESIAIIVKQHKKIQELSSEIYRYKDLINDAKKEQNLREHEMNSISLSMHASLTESKKNINVSRMKNVKSRNQNMYKIDVFLSYLKKFHAKLLNIIKMNNRINENCPDSLPHLLLKYSILKENNKELTHKSLALKGALKDYLSAISFDCESEALNPLLFIN